MQALFLVESTWICVFNYTLALSQLHSAARKQKKYCCIVFRYLIVKVFLILLEMLQILCSQTQLIKRRQMESRQELDSGDKLGIKRSPLL